MKPSQRPRPSWRERLHGRKPVALPDSADPAKSAEELLASANDAASSARNLYVTFLVFALYMAITIAATTDEQLLRDAPIKVPLLSDVNLPVSWFYAVAPWMLIVLHADLLLHFTLLGDKLHAFDASLHAVRNADQRKHLRTRLANFPFAHWIAGSGEDRSFMLFEGLIVGITLVTLPLGLLLFAQLEFLPFQSIGTTWSHRAAVLFDVWILAYFWPNIVQTKLGAARWWGKAVWSDWLTQLLKRGPRGADLRKAWRERSRGAFLLGLGSLFALFVSLFVALVPDEPWEKTLIGVFSPTPPQHETSTKDSTGNKAATVAQATAAQGAEGITLCSPFGELSVSEGHEKPKTAVQRKATVASQDRSASASEESLPSATQQTRMVTAVVIPWGMKILCPTALVFHSSLPLFRPFHSIARFRCARDCSSRTTFPSTTWRRSPLATTKMRKQRS